MKSFNLICSVLMVLSPNFASAQPSEDALERALIFLNAPSSAPVGQGSTDAERVAAVTMTAGLTMAAVGLTGAVYNSVMSGPIYIPEHLLQGVTGKIPDFVTTLKPSLSRYDIAARLGVAGLFLLAVPAGTYLMTKFANRDAVERTEQAANFRQWKKLRRFFELPLDLQIERARANPELGNFLILLAEQLQNQPLFQGYVHAVAQ